MIFGKRGFVGMREHTFGAARWDKEVDVLQQTKDAVFSSKAIDMAVRRYCIGQCI